MTNFNTCEECGVIIDNSDDSLCEECNAEYEKREDKDFDRVVSRAKFDAISNETLEAQMEALKDEEGFVQSLPNVITNILK